MKGIIIGVIVAFLGFMISVWYFQTSNKEVALRNLISAKQKDNQSELDNMQKKISQNTQVTKLQATALQKLVVGYADARGDSGGTLLKAVHEAVPNMDQSTYTALMNIITASRDGFTMRQKEILDMKREHDNLRMLFPSSIVCGGRPAIEVIVVTSTRAEENFRTGKDDDVELK